MSGVTRPHVRGNDGRRDEVDLHQRKHHRLAHLRRHVAVALHHVMPSLRRRTPDLEQAHDDGRRRRLQLLERKLLDCLRGMRRGVARCTRALASSLMAGSSSTTLQGVSQCTTRGAAALLLVVDDGLQRE